MGNAPSQNEISDKVHRQFLRQSHSIPIIKKKSSLNNKKKATTAAIYPNRRTSLPPSPTPSDPLPPRSNSHDNIVIKGRRYQNVNSKYMLPNDEQEQDRLVQVVSFI
jgi:hypothetical protein